MGEFSVVWPLVDLSAAHAWLWAQSPDLILFLGACLGVGLFVALVETAGAIRATRATK